MLANDIAANNKRIAKNTLLLYMRSILVMVISLFTSRVILASLGVDNYGIYTVVGGVVSMFSIISGSLSSSISRFLTYELGKNDLGKLRQIFSASINIQLGLCIVVFVLCESIGIWFLNSQMNIPNDRIYAANWVMQCSIVSFLLNLINVPYNSLIIAHEKMSAFAYISILQVSLQLLVAYLLYIVVFDKLIFYAFFLMLVSIIIQLVCIMYCHRNFKEAHYVKLSNFHSVREMSVFAGWTFVSDASSVLNTQGINILINLFFSVALNASRGVALQIENAIMRFVNDFTTSLNPQITKYYAQGEMEELYIIICRGAKYAFFLLLLVSMPFIIEASYVLDLWLRNPPLYSDVFFRLSIIAKGIALLGNTSYVACMATGRPKMYVVSITPVGFLIFIITLIAFEMGLSVTWAYWSVIIVNLILMIIRLRVMSKLIGFPISMYLNNVLAKVIPVLLLSFIFPTFIHFFMPYGFLRFCLILIFSPICCLLFTFLMGMNYNERCFVKKQVYDRLKFI